MCMETLIRERWPSAVIRDQPGFEPSCSSFGKLLAELFGEFLFNLFGNFLFNLFGKFLVNFFGKFLVDFLSNFFQ